MNGSSIAIDSRSATILIRSTGVAGINSSGVAISAGYGEHAIRETTERYSRDREQDVGGFGVGRESFAQARFVVAEQRASRDLRSVRVRENERASQPAGESERFALRERVRVLEIVATAKVPISGASVVARRRTRILSLLGHRRDRFAERRSARLDLRVR